MSTWIRDNSHYITLLLVFFLFFLLLTPLGAFSSWIAASDHTGYYSITRIDPADDARIYAFLRSSVIDGDIDFFNEKGLFSRFNLTPTGNSFNKMYAIGSALLWLPFFLVGHIIAHVYLSLGYPVITDGYSFPYLAMTGIGSATYLFLGIIILYDFLRNYFSRWVALVTVNVVWLGTFLPFYAFIRSRMAHANEFFMTCLLLYAWFYIRKRADVPVYLFLFGILAGFFCVVRLNDSPLLIFFAIDFLAILYSKYKLREIAAVKRILKGAATFAVIFVIVFSIPFVCAKIVWGDHLAISGIKQTTEGENDKVITPLAKLQRIFEKTEKENLWNFFLSKNKGLFLSSPFWLLALIGMYFFWRREKRWGSIVMIGLSFPVIFNIVHTSTGLEYGIRRTTPALPFLAFGFAALFEYTRLNQLKWKKTLIGLTGFLLIFWQYLQLIQHKVILHYNHPTFITTALSNVPKILMETPELLLRSSSWMKLILLKDTQFQDYNDIFFLLIFPALQLTAIVAVLLLYYWVKITLNADGNVNLNNRIIKITSVVGGIFFVFLPSLLLFTNPKADATEIKSRQNLAKEINKFDLVTRHNMVFADIDRIYHAIAISYNNSDQLEKSEKYVNKAISLKRDNNEAKFLLATLFHRTGRIPNAIKTYGEVLKMDPNHALSYKNLGIIYIDRKNYENATFYLQKFIALSPDQEEAAMLKSIIDRFPIKQN